MITQPTFFFSFLKFCFVPCSKMKGSDNQEKLVYQIIEDAGNKGEHVKDGALSLGLYLKCFFVLFSSFYF